MSPDSIPFWAQCVVALLLLCGSTLALIGAFGLLRLANFFQRIHSPALGNTLGTWCTVAASMLFFTLLTGRPVVHELMIGLFIVITAPVTSILLVRAALGRDRRARPGLEDSPEGETNVEDTGPDHGEASIRPRVAEPGSASS
ncbi:cation:proton antiporter [Verticiella sediminum]|uniref:Cation:proton antiporter n=1 Tax=Verticiella sediminum TaxID=1247510 RepID=A0A556AS75_9BURK|nr:monovalent cation/H(+) antiporter subunit G [Verticiella sediminum]TSH95814.1 cation:proton antiporter [Verticiella sediminum]